MALHVAVLCRRREVAARTAGSHPRCGPGLGVDPVGVDQHLVPTVSRISGSRVGRAQLRPRPVHVSHKTTAPTRKIEM